MLGKKGSKIEYVAAITIEAWTSALIGKETRQSLVQHTVCFG